MFIRKSKRLSRIVIAALLLTMFGWLLPGNFMVEKANAATTLKNPIIVKDSSMNSGQKVTWDCVYFGSYPQTEVLNENDSEAIYNFEEMNSGEGEDTLEYLKVSASKWKSIVNASYDSNGDATVGSERYRRIKAEDATYAWIIDPDEEYPELKDIYYNWLDTTNYNYFKYEPIKWRVLEVNGSDIFLLAYKGLECHPYNLEYDDITWEKSTIRSWLNGYSASSNLYGKSYTGKGFIDTAFLSSEEKNKIKTTDVVNKDNLQEGAEGGKDTKDKIYLLSESEVYQTEAAKSYGFIESEGDGFESELFDEGRRAVSSTYSTAMGNYIGSCYWWLRSPGYDTRYAAGVDNYGYVYYNGDNVHV